MSKLFQLTIRLGNDAMQTHEDVRDALQRVLDKFERGQTAGKILDVNGNTVGVFGFQS